MAFGAQAVIEQPYDLVVERTRQALHEQGLYVVNETDISAALHAYLDFVVPRQVVLDVWHLHLARAVVEVDPPSGFSCPAASSSERKTKLTPSSKQPNPRSWPP